MTADVALDSVAVYRLTRLAQVDAFPPVRSLRERIVQRWPEDDWRTYLAGCPWCLSVWIAAGVLVVRRTRAWRAARFLLIASAVSGVLSERF